MALAFEIKWGLRGGRQVIQCENGLSEMKGCKIRFEAQNSFLHRRRSGGKQVFDIHRESTNEISRGRLWRSELTGQIGERF